MHLGLTSPRWRSQCGNCSVVKASLSMDQKYVAVTLHRQSSDSLHREMSVRYSPGQNIMQNGRVVQKLCVPKFWRCLDKCSIFFVCYVCAKVLQCNESNHTIVVMQPHFCGWVQRQPHFCGCTTAILWLCRPGFEFPTGPPTFP